MNESVRKLSDRLREIEKRTIEDIRSRQTSQSFGGALRVDPDKVFINEHDGRRAIESLRKLVR
ncbi:hypothetical protein [Pseudoxanthomonas sp. X-1]|uniref:hypothetical protein n=1 Tax=Pseudoxanthomonas sp. X-1 TaxID=2571115 RepID=UPI00110AC692|nr:hypothetical protein [Pseudoxanthomonas sp. X-1]TMN19669.1 hypothetical protein FF950_10685 [Pseudoxanthomonas sp. X-1]UAY74336.1 hypothetical protein LAJ50_18055 [Pseudoxanthomonas sp. X-1]